jgi:hypothetical protein
MLDLLGRPAPEDEAVAWIDVVSVLLWTVQLDKMLVQYPSFKVIRQNLRLLLTVPSLPVKLVSLLELTLA